MVQHFKLDTTLYNGSEHAMTMNSETLILNIEIEWHFVQ
jgi:hypothetical protein